MKRPWIIVGLVAAVLTAAGVWWVLTPRTLTVEDRHLLRPGMSLAEAARALGRPPDRDETHRPVYDETVARVAAGVDPTRQVAWEAADGWIIAGVSADRITYVCHATRKDFFR